MTDRIALIDTNVIIDNSKNLINITNVIQNYNKIFISIITYIELLGYNFKSEKEYNLIKELVNLIPITFIDLEIADYSVNYSKIKKIKLADSLILATARSLNGDLITSNIDDFTNIDFNVRIYKPSEIE